MSFTVDIKVADSAQVKEMIAVMGEHIVKLSMALQEALEWFDGDRSRLRELSALLSAPDIAAWRAKHQALKAALDAVPTDWFASTPEAEVAIETALTAAREVVG